MSSNVSVLEKTIQTKIRTRLKDAQDEAMSLVQLIVSAEKTVEVVDFDGANNFTAVSGTSAPAYSKIRGFKSSSNPSRHEVFVPWNRDQAMDEEKLADIISDMVVSRARQKVALSVFTFIFGARAIAHPDNGVSGSPLAAQGGGTVYCVDAFTVTIINAGGTFNRDNDGTDALTATNLQTKLDERDSYRDRDGGQGTATNVKPWLVVVPQLGSLAKSLYAQEGEVYDGTGLRPGFKDRLKGVIVAPPGATAATDAWALVYESDVVDDKGAVIGSTSPICVHMRDSVQARWDKIPGTGVEGVYCDLAYDVFPHPMIDRDLNYSEP